MWICCGTGVEKVAKAFIYKEKRNRKNINKITLEKSKCSCI